MNARLDYGHVYRATVAIPPVLRPVVTPEWLKETLQRYQLFGRAEEIPGGYSVQAEFRGKSGSYTLPEQVTALALVR
jgi:hypothetical protein